MGLTSLALVKNFLGINPANVSKDFQLVALMDAADAVVKNYCRRDFEVNTYTHYFEGTDRREIVLRQVPVISVTNVWQDFYGSFGDSPTGAFPDSTKLVFGVDYDLDWDLEYPAGSGTRVCMNGKLLRMSTIWQARSRSYYPLQLTPESQSSDGTIKVVYTAGFSPIPMDIQLATAWIVAYLRRTIVIGGELDEERIGDYQYHIWHPKYFMIPEIGSAREVLNKYREVVL